MPIPRIIHQTWKTTQVPGALQGFVDSCKDLNKDYEYKFYTDSDLRSVVATYFPSYLKLYAKFMHNIERVDFARYAILWSFGGVYSDIDVQCLRKFDHLLDQEFAVFATEPVEHRERLYGGRSTVICNAVMLSPPRNPIWTTVMAYIAESYVPGRDPVYNTGPMMLTRLYEKSPEVFYKSARILPSCTFYAQSDRMTNKTQQGIPFISRECDLKKDKPVTIHRWAHTWIEGDSPSKQKTKRTLQITSYVVVALAVAALLTWGICKALKHYTVPSRS